MTTYNGTATIDVNDMIELDKRSKLLDIVRKDNIALRKIALKAKFNNYRLVSTTREEATEIRRDGTPGYSFAFYDDDVAKLKAVGITIDDMIEFIHEQYDAKEREDAEKTEDAMEE